MVVPYSGRSKQGLLYIKEAVALIGLVLYFRKIFLSKICILFCLVSLNSVFFNLVCFDLNK